MGLMASYALKSGDFFSQADLGPKMLPKNKLGLRPHDIKGKAEVDKIFQRFKEQSS
jgi:heterodisulfide reductase subunit C